MASTKKDLKQQAIDKNYAFFKSVESKYIEQYKGQHALLRHEEIIAFYDTAHDAYITGMLWYKDGLFSIQQLDEKPVYIWSFPRAVHLG